MSTLFSFGNPINVRFDVDEGTDRPHVDMDDENGNIVSVPVFYNGEDVSGRIVIELKKAGQKLDHNGICLELLGRIETHGEKSLQQVFCHHSKMLCLPGILKGSTTFEFNFPSIEKTYETYKGINCELIYVLKLEIQKRMSNLIREHQLLVHSLSSFPDSTNSPITMEVGIEDCLHIEFEYNKSRYHLKDVVVGKIFFDLVRLKIKYTEISILKMERCGTGDNSINHSTTITNFEIMDGAPIKGESIPIRLFLANHQLTPTMRDVQKKFSVRYYINILLVDEEERRYYKQQEIILWRKADIRLPLHHLREEDRRLDEIDNQISTPPAQQQQQQSISKTKSTLSPDLSHMLSNNDDEKEKKNKMEGDKLENGEKPSGKERTLLDQSAGDQLLDDVKSDDGIPEREKINVKGEKIDNGNDIGEAPSDNDPENNEPTKEEEKKESKEEENVPEKKESVNEDLAGEAPNDNSNNDDSKDESKNDETKSGGSDDSSSTDSDEDEDGPKANEDDDDDVGWLND
ncbi:hypothetical protein SNEBB_001802 [Seison nebaliae]|nr:hypothetical protein SNEBB_001802 [Seison nebaliae]